MRLIIQYIFIIAISPGLLVSAPGLLVSTIVTADEDKYLIREFRESDRYFVSLSIERLNELTSAHFGVRLSGQKQHDLAYLQRLLSEDIVKPDNTRMLQAMGIALGEILLSERELKWVRYVDPDGISRALQLKHQEYYIYPVTLVSRRAAAGIEVDITDLYHDTLQKLDDYIEQYVYQ